MSPARACPELVERGRLNFRAVQMQIKLAFRDVACVAQRAAEQNQVGSDRLLSSVVKSSELR